MSGKGHPLPGSDEARHGEIPEHLERDKGLGDDVAEAIQPAAEPVNPDGIPYSGEERGRPPDQRQDDHEADRGRDQNIAGPQVDES